MGRFRADDRPWRGSGREAASGLSCPPAAGVRRSDVGLVAGRVCNLSGGLLSFARPHRDVRCGAGVGCIGLVVAFAVAILLARRFLGRVDRDAEIVRLRNLREQLLGIPDLFWQLLGREAEEEVDSVTAAPVSNYAEAEHTVTVVLNPSCPDCARICDVIGKLKGVRIDLIFVVDDGDRRAYDVALRLISSGITSEWGETFRLLAAWYGRGRVPATPIHPLAGNDLSAQLNYCRRIRIVRTPTILVDNRRLPALYDAEDLKILL